MITVMREKFGPVIIGSIIAVIAAVFIFYGIFMGPGTGNSQGPGSPGSVNGEPISYSEYSKALNQRTEFFRNMMGGKISEDQLEKFNLRGAVFQDLVQRKLVGQMAKKEGFVPSAEQVRDQILKMEVFKKDGRFDRTLYKNVLTQNNYTPTRFEELIGQDLTEQNFRNFINSLAVVGDEEVNRDLKVSKERRRFKYVFIDNETVRKMLPAAKDAKPEDQNKALNQKVAELTKEVSPNLAKGEAKINALFKDGKIKVKTTEWMNGQSDMIAGVGSIKSIRPTLFEMKKGEAPRNFSMMGGTLIILSNDLETFDPEKITQKDRADALARLEGQKQNEIFSELIKTWMKKASISKNDKIVGAATKGGGPANVPIDADM